MSFQVYLSFSLCLCPNYRPQLQNYVTEQQCRKLKLCFLFLTQNSELNWWKKGPLRTGKYERNSIVERAGEGALLILYTKLPKFLAHLWLCMCRMHPKQIGKASKKWAKAINYHPSFILAFEWYMNKTDQKRMAKALETAVRLKSTGDKVRQTLWSESNE